MKWVIFTGSWRITNEEVDRDVRAAVRDVISRGDGVITGGALGVDWICMDEAIKVNPTCTQLRVIIPSKVNTYINHFLKRLNDKIITQEAFDNLEKTLHAIQKVNPSALMEMHFTHIDQSAYDDRDNEEVKYGDEVNAFHVNNSPGTQHTIDSAVKKGIPVTLHKKYTI